MSSARASNGHNKKFKIKASTSIDSIKAYQGSTMVITSEATVEQVAAIPPTCKGVILFSGVTADVVRAFPQTVIQAGLHGVAPDVVRTFGSSIIRVYLYSATTVDAVKAIPQTVSIVYSTPGVAEDVKNAIPPTKIILSKDSSTDIVEIIPPTANARVSSSHIVSPMQSSGGQKRSAQQAGLSTSEVESPAKRPRIQANGPRLFAGYSAPILPPLPPQPSAPSLLLPSVPMELRIQALESLVIKLDRENAALQKEVAELRAEKNIDELASLALSQMQLKK